MSWLFRRLLAPFALGSIACTVLLMIWTPAVEAETSLRLSDVLLAALFILPFEAIGLILLLPIALLLGDLSLSRPLSAVAVVAAGAVIGKMVVLPIAETPMLLQFDLAAACGAISAVVWLTVNQDVVRR